MDATVEGRYDVKDYSYQMELLAVRRERQLVADATALKDASQKSLLLEASAYADAKADPRNRILNARCLQSSGCTPLFVVPALAGP